MSDRSTDNLSEVTVTLTREYFSLKVHVSYLESELKGSKAIQAGQSRRIEELETLLQQCKESK